MTLNYARVAWAAFALLTTFSTNVTAGSVVKNWPKGKANTCKNPSIDIFFDFERGVDRAEVKMTKPGMAFTNTEGLNWLYAAYSNGNYNTQYSWNGDGFGWLGERGNIGRITFTGGLATYFSVLVGTYSTLTLEAYDSNNTLVDSAQASGNVGTGEMTQLTVSHGNASDDNVYGIEYVLIHDTGNYWLIDDICTDATSGCIPLKDGYSVGSKAKRIDLVFIKDVDYTRTNEYFLSKVKEMIDERLLKIAPVRGFNDSFNFYVSYLPGDSDNVDGKRCGEAVLPPDFANLCPFYDAAVVVHADTFTDCHVRKVFSTEDNTKSSFIHEAGHGLFGLTDEYDDFNETHPKESCKTRRAATSTNTYVSRADCEKDVRAHPDSGWTTDDCYMFTKCESNECRRTQPPRPRRADLVCDGGQWKINETKKTIMVTGYEWKNGYSPSSTWRIMELLKTLGKTASDAGYIFAEADPDKAVIIRLEINDEGVWQLEPATFVFGNPPEYFFPHYDYKVTVYDADHVALGEFGFDDPRLIQYGDPNQADQPLAQAQLQLVIPLFSSNAYALIKDATHELLAVDLSPTISGLTTETNRPPTAICKNVVINANEGTGCQANMDVADLVNNGSFDLDNDNIAIEVSPTGPYRGTVQVTLKVRDTKGASDTCEATIVVQDAEDLDIDLIKFNHSGIMKPQDVPVRFTPSYTKRNGCAAFLSLFHESCHACNAKGKAVDRKSCRVRMDSGNVTIKDSGGNGDFITIRVKASDTNPDHEPVEHNYTICVGKKGFKGKTRGTYCPSTWNPRDSLVCRAGKSVRQGHTW